MLEWYGVYRLTGRRIVSNEISNYNSGELACTLPIMPRIRITTAMLCPTREKSKCSWRVS